MLMRPNRSLVTSLLQIREGEACRVGLMLLYSVAAVGGVIITGQLVSRALFLSSLPQEAIPYKYILPPVALVLASAVLTRVSGRYRSDRLIMVSYSMMLVGVGGFWLLLQTPWRSGFWVLCALFVYIDVISSLVILQFWTFAGEIFNSMEAKRLFGLISGGSTISNVLFGALISWISAAVEPAHLLFIVMLSLVFCVVAVSQLSRRYDELLVEASGLEQPETEVDEGSLWADLRDVSRVPLIRCLGGILVMVALVSSIGDYQLDLALQVYFGDNSPAMVGFLGRFRLWAGMGAGMLQFLLAGRLMARFGVVVVLLLLPSSMVLGAGGILLTGGALWAAATPRACDVVLKYSVNDPAYNLLFLPVEAVRRAKARAILDGIVKPPVVTVLGLAFLWAGQSGTSTIVHWAYAMLALVGIWYLFVLSAGRRYVTALSQSIRFRRLDPERETIDLTDERAIQVIRQTLHTPEAPRVIHALTLLPGLPRTDWTPHVAMLLDHPDPEVRMMALRHLGQSGAAIYAEEVVARLDDDHEGVCAAAVETLCALGKLRVINRVLPYLEDSKPRIRAAAVLGLIKHMGLDGFLHAGEHLKAMLTSDDVAARREAARVLGELHVPSFYHPLITLLEDDSTDVQVAAIRAAAEIRAPELIPHLTPRLAHPITQWYATQALSSCIGRHLERLESLLDHSAGSTEVRRQLVYLLRFHPSPRSVKLLCVEVSSQDERLRAMAYGSLMVLQAHGIPMQTSPLREALQRELHRAHELHMVRRDLQGVDLLLDEALQERIDQAKTRILMLLDLLYPEVSYEWMRDALENGEGRDNATAVELLENLLEWELRNQLLPLFQPERDELPEVAETILRITQQAPEDRLRELARNEDGWLRGCAVRVMGDRKMIALIDVVREMVDDDHRLVRESAVVALAQLEDNGRGPDPPRRHGTGMGAGAGLGLRIGTGSGDERMALSTLEKVFFLKSVPLFEDIPGEDIVGMVPILQEVSIRQGETFIRRGDPGDALYIVVAGEIQVHTDKGKDLVVHAREVIGERSVLTRQLRSADCTAMTDVVVLRVDHQDFWQLMEEHPKITIQILKVVANRYI